VGYVLGKWTEEEQKLLPAVIKRAAATAESVVLSGTSAAMNLHNSGKEDNAAPLGPE
jgi:peptidyl-tRNA hydrolase